MRNKFANFLSEKKDLLIFIGVLILTFVSVITIATLASREEENPETNVGAPVEDPETPSDDKDILPPISEPEQVFTFVLPIDGEYVIAREFFDLNDETTIASAVKSNGTTYRESTGISYAKADNSIFDVLCSYPGEVIKIEGNDDSLEGYTVTIAVEKDIYTIYSSLSEVNVKIGDNVDLKQKIGVSGTSINDLDAKIHVHFQVINNNEFINPKTVMGKEITAVTSSMK